MKRSLSILFTAMSLCAAQDQAALDKLLGRIVERENAFIELLRARTPLIETYIQEGGSEGASAPLRDHYLLGRLAFGSGIEYTPITARTDSPKPSRLPFFRKGGVSFVPDGFAQMIFVDAQGLSQSTYGFEYVRREFLGEIRCLAFDVAPKDPKAQGRFIGRIWVEDRDFSIVRFNGTYTESKDSSLYFHFDSWRLNVAPREWVPAFIYVEESGEGKGKVSFKAQTRLWGYNSGEAARLDELTGILVELDTPVTDSAAAQDSSPLESQRSWERQAEQNIIDRLVRSGMVSPKGGVEQVLDGVIANLSAGANIPVEVSCRVLLTTPLETFSVGQTIFISRGLLDVLPDEASLAMVLSDELAHIALGHRTNTQFAFHNQTMFTDEELMQRFRFSRSPEEIAEAGKKAVEILRKSQYKEKMANAGLFLRALASRAPHFPNLIRANIGNQLANGETLVRMGDLASQAPDLQEQSLEQIAALPLGSRIRLDPWTNAIALIKTKPVSLLSAREKLFFEITPFVPHLARFTQPQEHASR